MTTSSETTTFHPSLLWAQSKTKVFLTFEVSDSVKPIVKFADESQKSKLIFDGTCSKTNKRYFLELDLFEAVESMNAAVNPLNVFVVLDKNSQQTWWPRLLSSAGKKPNFLKTDFSRWKEEDEDEENEKPEFGDLDFSKFAGSGGNDAMMMDDESDSIDEAEESQGNDSKFSVPEEETSQPWVGDK